MYATTSRLATLLSEKLTCPTCGTIGCSGAPNLGNKCSNNPSVTKNASPAEDPENPSSLPSGSAEMITVSTEAVCGNECSSQKDCKCGDYLCLENQSLSRQSAKQVLGCVFVIGSSFSWGRVSGNVPRRRDIDTAPYPHYHLPSTIDLSTCACNATFTGEACCYAPGGIVQ